MQLIFERRAIFMQAWVQWVTKQYERSNVLVNYVMESKTCRKKRPIYNVDLVWVIHFYFYFLVNAGAVARIACLATNENGYETAPFSILSNECDANGYFFVTLLHSFLKKGWKIKDCKAYLYSSPLGTCQVPVDVNHGISGAPLSSYRILNDKHIKLYSVGPFFYTSKPQSLPNGY